jgi:rfaE bifunctional protein kinase chain/domain
MANKVLVPGKFVVLHAGHIRLFRFARELGNFIIAAIDISGLSQEQIRGRLDVLSNLEFVDSVEIFDGDISNLLESVKPEVVLKGREFANLFNIEASILQSYGGRLVFSSGVTFYSEEDLVESITSQIHSNIIKLGNEFLNRNNIKVKDLLNVFDEIRNIRTCVIGDIIVDEVINCHPVGMSKEDPTIVVTPVNRTKFVGGAGIVAAHCNSLGSTTTIVTVLGNDEPAEWCKVEAAKIISEVIIFSDDNRKTTLKQRFKSGKQVLLKLNHFSQEPIPNQIENDIYEYFVKNICNFDLLIFSDFSYGTLSANLAGKLIDLARKFDIFIVADSQTSSQSGNLSKFIGANFVTPTEIEARNEIRDDLSGLVVVAQQVRKLLKANYVLLKLGADGVLLDGVTNNGESISTDLVPSLNKNPVDTSGAGDSMLAGSALTLACGKTLYVSAFIGSLMSAIQVSRIGNTPIQKEQIQNILLQ